MCAIFRGLPADLVSPNRWAFPVWATLKFSRQTAAVLKSLCAKNCLSLTTSFYLMCVQSVEQGTIGIQPHLQA